MKTRTMIAALLVVALIVAPAASAFGTSASFDVRRIAGSPIDFLDQQGQDLNGRYLAYESRNNLEGAPRYKIQVYDRAADSASALHTTGGDQMNASVWNGLVAYQDNSSGNWDIRLHDLWGGTDTLIAGGAGDQVEPQIQDDVVVWRSGTDVYFRDLRDGVTHKAPTGVTSAGNVGTSRRYIYYQDDDVQCDVYRYDHAWEETVCLSGNLTGAGNWAGDLAVHDDSVVWRAMRFEWPHTAIRGYDVRSGVESTIVTNGFTREQPDVFGWAHAYVDDVGGTRGVRARIEGWSSGSVVSTTTVMEDPSIYGNSVAFGPGYDVWLGEHPTTSVRVSGVDRYATAAEISERHFSESGVVVLASGEDWPDALMASGVAGAHDAPLLLVRKGAIPDATYQEIVRLGATSFVIVGGTGVVSQDVEDTLIADFGESSTHRIWGVDRYATSKQAAYWIADMTDMEPFNGTFSQEALFVSGQSFADALAAAPIAAARHMPVLLVRPQSLPTEISDTITGLSLEGGVIIGGTGAVEAGVKTAIDAKLLLNPGGVASERWWGADRYETARNVADNAVRARWLDLDALAIVKGTDFADALGAGAALGSYGSPLVLTHPLVLPTATRDFLADWTYDIGELQVVGGTGAVGAGVMTTAEGYLSP